MNRGPERGTVGKALALYVADLGLNHDTPYGLPAQALGSDPWCRAE